MSTPTSTFEVKDITQFKLKALAWANQFPHLTCLNNNGIAYPFGPFPDLVAAGARSVLKSTGRDSFAALKNYHQRHRDWLFGYFSYDLKNEIEDLHSHHFDRMGFDKIYFYQPEHLILMEGTKVIIRSAQAARIFKEIVGTRAPIVSRVPPGLLVQANIDRESYLRKVKKIRQHIIEGDVYELNLCMEFFAEGAVLDPVSLHLLLNEASPMPFSSFQKTGNKYLISASPERFIKKQGQQLISQPIKGTIRRGKTAREDRQLREQLRQDEKELAENMMIVDLVRNDLARSALPGSVKAEELFAVYSFRQVHQMISTISAVLREGIHGIDAVRNAFPMGSMTGAPKIKAMQLIEAYETARRGVYSGAAGYIKPDGDFDFSVVIRSILYDRSARHLSFQVGSAITYDSIPEKEYAECLLKAQAIREVLGATV